MLKRLSQICTLMALSISLCFAADVVTAVHGTVTKVDNATKTIVVKTKDGTEHTLHFVAKTTVHGKASTTATFSEPGDYILHVVANDWTGEGGHGFQCCWSNAQVKVSVKK